MIIYQIRSCVTVYSALTHSDSVGDDDADDDTYNDTLKCLYGILGEEERNGLVQQQSQLLREAKGQSILDRDQEQNFQVVQYSASVSSSNETLRNTNMGKDRAPQVPLMRHPTSGTRLNS